LIPIPWVSHNEQQVNAEFVRESGLAIILPEKELTEESFVRNIDAAFNLPDASVDNSFPELCQKAAQNILNEVLLAHKTQKA